MNKVIMVPEDRYNRMIDSYDKAIEELASVKGQMGLLMAGSKVVEVLQSGEELQKTTVLDDIFNNFTDNGDYQEQEAKTPEPIRRLMKWMDSHIESFPEELGDSIIQALGDYERLWFINGFRCAIGIVQAC